MVPFHIQPESDQRILCFHITQDCDCDTIFAFYHLSKKMRYRYYQQGCVYTKNKRLTQNHSLRCGEQLFIAPIHEEEEIIPWAKPIEICYEDDCFLVVNKPVGMLVHSDGNNQNHTLHNCIKAYYQAHALDVAVRSVHRLDLDTSGLVLYIKHPFFQAYMDHLIAEKDIQRCYLAWVKGRITQTSLIIDQPLGRDRHHAGRMRIHAQGKAACTKVKVKKRLKDATLVECQLLSGRTHQIRVHLASIGHPLLSDALYGTKDSRIHRCALHAWKLEFYHPLKQAKQTICCPLPEDMDI